MCWCTCGRFDVRSLIFVFPITVESLVWPSQLAQDFGKSLTEDLNLKKIVSFSNYETTCCEIITGNVHFRREGYCSDHFRLLSHIAMSVLI